MRTSIIKSPDSVDPQKPKFALHQLQQWIECSSQANSLVLQESSLFKPYPSESGTINLRKIIETMHSTKRLHGQRTQTYFSFKLI